MVEFNMDIFAKRSEIEQDGKFKKGIAAEMPVEVDLKATCRSYMESLNAIHQSTRELIKHAVVSARADIEAVHQRYAKLYDGSLVGLTAFVMVDRKAVSSIPLLLDWDDIRLQLQRRNGSLVNLRRRYVSGKLQTRNS